ncbi:hypothetical protein ACTJI5_21895 [Sphingopyxis sp. 22461]
MKPQRGVRRSGGLIASLIAIVLLSGCGAPEPDRYRMTVEVLTPAGVVSGSAVREVRFSERADWFPFGESKAHAAIAGEAVAVKLPSGQVVYALLAGDANDLNYASGLMGRTLGSGENRKADHYELWPNPSGNVRDLPILAYFKNRSDPTSFSTFDRDDFSSIFGRGVYLNKIYIERTGDPVTWKLRSDIPSLETDKVQNWVGTLKYDDPRSMILGGLVRGSKDES